MGHFLWEELEEGIADASTPGCDEHCTLWGLVAGGGSMSRTGSLQDI